MKNFIILLAFVVLASGCVGRVKGWSRFRYEWWSTLNHRKVHEIFGPFIFSKHVELYKPGLLATGEFLPKSPDGYNVLLRGYVLDKDRGWVEDIVMPWVENKLRDLLYMSNAKLEVRVSAMGRELVCRRIVLAEAMKMRSRGGAIYLNYYPLMYIETSSLPASTPISVSVSVCEPDMAFAEYDGRIELVVRGHVEPW